MDNSRIIRIVETQLKPRETQGLKTLWISVRGKARGFKKTETSKKTSQACVEHTIKVKCVKNESHNTFTG